MKKGLVSTITNTKLGRKALVSQVEPEVQVLISQTKEVISRYYGSEKGTKTKKYLLKFAVKFLTALKEKKVNKAKLKEHETKFNDELETLISLCEDIRNNKEENAKIEKSFQRIFTGLDYIVETTKAIFEDFISDKNQAKLATLFDLFTNQAFIKAFLSDKEFDDLSASLILKAKKSLGATTSTLLKCEIESCENLQLEFLDSRTAFFPRRCRGHFKDWAKGLEKMPEEERLSQILAKKNEYGFFVDFLEDAWIKIYNWLIECQTTQNVSMKLNKIENVLDSKEEIEGVPDSMEKIFETVEKNWENDKVTMASVQGLTKEVLGVLLGKYREFRENEKYSEFCEALDKLVN